MKVIVVGAGVFGSWTARTLAKAGHQVTLLDQMGPGNEFSSSAGESRIIRSAYGRDELYTALAQRALCLWHDFFFEEQLQDCFRKTGVLWMAPAENESIWLARTTFERVGITHEWLDARAIGMRYKQFRVPDHAVALWEPDGGALFAQRSVAAVAASAVTFGVAYETARILPPVVRGEALRSLQTEDGRRWEADCFIFACGAWMAKLFLDLGPFLSPTRQELFFFKAPQDQDEFAEHSLPIWIDQLDAKIAYGFPDFGHGVKLGFHRLGPAMDPDALRLPPDARAIREASEYLGVRFPNMRGANVQATQVCAYENTPNGDFIIDTHPAGENVWIVGGGSGHGFKHGPAVAEYLLQVLEGSRGREGRFSFSSKIGSRERVL